MAEIGGVLSASSGATRSRPMKAVRFVLFSDYLVLALTALYIAALWFVVPEIVSPTNLNDIFLQVLPLFVAAMGVMMVLLVAQIDLSATSIMAMSCVVGASIMTSQDGYLAGQTSAPIVAVLAIVAIGLLIGLLNGVCTIVFDIPSFLVTLTTMMFFSGAAIWYTAAPRAWRVKLMVLVRSRPEESVLRGCKFSTSGTNGPASTTGTCRVGGVFCSTGTST